MKTINIITRSLLLGLFLTLSANVRAQDPIKTAPNLYTKVILENDKIRVMQFELPAKESVPWHSHPDHFVYALTDGKLEITDKGKAPVVAEIKAGEAIFMVATTHMAKNMGDATVKLIVTELKPTNTQN